MVVSDLDLHCVDVRREAHRKLETALGEVVPRLRRDDDDRRRSLEDREGPVGGDLLGDVAVVDIVSPEAGDQERQNQHRDPRALGEFGHGDDD